MTFMPGHVAMADTLDFAGPGALGDTVVFEQGHGAAVRSDRTRLRKVEPRPTGPWRRIAQATLPTQRVVHGTLADIAETGTARTGGFGAPALLFVGEVTRVLQQQRCLRALSSCLEGVA